MIQDYLRNDKREDLVFAPTFTKEERATLHRVAHRFGLRTRSQNQDDQRYLVLSRKRTARELVAHVRANGGETFKYILLEPNCLQSADCEVMH